MARLTGPLSGFVHTDTVRTTSLLLPLGTRAYTHDGKEFVYVRAGAAVAAMNAVKFEGSAGGFDAVIPVSGSDYDEVVLGVATAAFADLEYGFVQVKGVVTALVDDSTPVGSILVASAAVAGAFGLPDGSTLAGVSPAVALTLVTDSSTTGAVVHLG